MLSWFIPADVSRDTGNVWSNSSELLYSPRRWSCNPSTVEPPTDAASQVFFAEILLVSSGERLSSSNDSLDSRLQTAAMKVVRKFFSAYCTVTWNILKYHLIKGISSHIFGNTSFQALFSGLPTTQRRLSVSNESWCSLQPNWLVHFWMHETMDDIAG